MNVNILENEIEVANQIAIEVEEIIVNKPDALICLCAGHSPVLVLKKLVSDAKEGKYPTDRFKFVSLDEWVGLGIEDSGSCIHDLSKYFLKPLQLCNDRFFFFHGLSKDLEEECKKAEEFIECNGGIDVILLGIGLNGHVGFNEPPSKKTDGIRVINLSETSKMVSDKYFDKEHDIQQGITLGIAQIMQAKKVMVMATGKHKRNIVEQALNGNEDENCPVTLIMKHDNIHMFLDELAAPKAE